MLHPLHVLQSQLENVYGILHRRDEPDGDYYAGRLRLAIEVMANALGSLLDAGRVREALNAAERIAEIATQRPALAAWQRDGIEVLGSIPEHHSWPEEFASRRREQIANWVQLKRDKLPQRKLN